jgi:hypothetical protein
MLARTFWDAGTALSLATPDGRRLSATVTALPFVKPAG